LDKWIAAQTMPTLAPTSPPAQTHVIFAWDSCFADPHPPPLSHIEEVVETHILEVRDVLDSNEEEEETGPRDIFKVFAAEKKRCDNRPNKVLELVTPWEHWSQANNARGVRPPFKYQSNAEDHLLVTELEVYLMKGKLSLTTPAHVFAVSPIICKDIIEKL